MASTWIYRSRFRLVDCPVPGCCFGRGGRPVSGTLPGIRRHVRQVHGGFAYRRIAWCSANVWEGSPWSEELRLAGEAGRERLALLPSTNYERRLASGA